MANETLISSAW